MHALKLVVSVNCCIKNIASRNWVIGVGFSSVLALYSSTIFPNFNCCLFVIVFYRFKFTCLVSKLKGSVCRRVQIYSLRLHQQLVMMEVFNSMQVSIVG